MQHKVWPSHHRQITDQKAALSLSALILTMPTQFCRISDLEVNFNASKILWLSQCYIFLYKTTKPTQSAALASYRIQIRFKVVCMTYETFLPTFDNCCFFTFLCGVCNQWV